MEQVNDSTILSLIRKYLKAGVMEKGLESAKVMGVPQDGLCGTLCNPPHTDTFLMLSHSL